MKHANIPIFIPHMGCPNNCVFCNQRSISGHTDFHREDVEKEITTALSTIDKSSTECEIAFFGGSFTGIDRELMIYLLDCAEKFVRAGDVKSIRLSTRPDYISDEILQILSRYSVRTIELGIQSVSDSVLSASKRGHSFICSEKACAAVVSHGFELVGQMMIGLPGASVADETATAEFICRTGAKGARVYPTVVFTDTELCEMTKSGEYSPLTYESAAERTAEVLKVFYKNQIPVIRVGLCASENLADESRVFAGANHPAIGEMAMSRVYYDVICEKIRALGVPTEGKNLEICVPQGGISKAVGQKAVNKRKICAEFGINSIKVIEKNIRGVYNILVYIS